MLAQIFKSGQASRSSASMRSLPVVKTPCLPCSRAISSAFDQAASDWFDSTSKCCSSFAMVSGKMARATRTLGLFMSAEEDVGGDGEERHEDRARPRHVAEEARHRDAAVFGDRLN